MKDEEITLLNMPEDEGWMYICVLFIALWELFANMITGVLSSLCPSPR